MTTLQAPLMPLHPKSERVTAEQLLQMADRNRYELVQGQLEERRVSSESSRIGARIVRLLGDEAERTGLAVVYGADLGYQCFNDPDDPDLVRKPDASVLSIDRWTALPGDPGYLRVPADLAVEVISPNELHRTVTLKLEQYLSAGFARLWVADPSSRTVVIYRADGSVARLKADDEINAGPILPEFRCRVADLFLPPTRGATR